MVVDPVLAHKADLIELAVDAGTPVPCALMAFLLAADIPLHVAAAILSATTDAVRDERARHSN